MGPLSVKADVQAKAGAAKNQMLVIKTLADEARKKKQAAMKDAHAQELHQLKMAKEIAKAKAEGISIDEKTIGASDGMLSIPKPGTQQPDTTIKGNNKVGTNTNRGVVIPKPGTNQPGVTLENPEAGPSDTIPAMLTPGEAVIPASVAQDSAYKPVIEALVEEGRMRNRMPGGVKGLADGTPELPPMGTMPKKKSIWEMMTSKKADKPKDEPKKEDGSMIDQAKGVLGGRAAQLAAQEKKAMGYADGTLGDDDVMMHESGGDPLAKNPNSSATGLYQMIGAARKDVEQFRPDLKQKDFSDPKVQTEYRDTYKGILAQRLQQSGIDPNENNINKAWVVGAGGLQKVSANPDAPLEMTLGEGVTKINPNLQGKTGAEFLADPNPYSRKGITESQNESAAEKARLAGIPKPAIPPGNPGFDSISGGANVMGMQGAQYFANMPGQKPEVKQNLNKVVQQEMAPALQGQANRQAFSDARFDAMQAEKAAEVPPKVAPASTAAIPPVEDDKMKLPVNVQAKQEILSKAMEDPGLKEQLATLQQTPPPPGVEPKDWLSKGIAKIFGPTGMFNEEDLIRFSLLAAGGLLTGGSVGGSFRFAGLSTLRESDERRRMQAVAANQQAQQARAAQIANAKDWQNRVQTLETDFVNKLDKVPPEIQAEAQKLFDASRKAKTVQEREANLTAALRILGGAKDHTKEDGGEKLNTVQEGRDARTGKPINYYTNKKNEFFVVDDEGNHKPVKGSGLKVVSESQYKNTRVDQEKDVTRMVKERLVDSNRRADGSLIDKSKTDSYFATKAEGMASTLMGLRDYFGHDIDSKQFGKLVSNTVANMGEELSDSKIKSMSPEALVKIVLGSAVMDSRPSSAKYYKAGTESGRPGKEANLMYSEVVDKAKASGRDVTQFVDGLEKAYDGLKPAEKKKFENAAKAGPNIGYSPYLLWVRETLTK